MRDRRVLDDEVRQRSVLGERGAGTRDIATKVWRNTRGFSALGSESGEQ
jgi:hypothetical protein